MKKLLLALTVLALFSTSCEMEEVNPEANPAEMVQQSSGEEDPGERPKGN